METKLSEGQIVILEATFMRSKNQFLLCCVKVANANNDTYKNVERLYYAHVANLVILSQFE